MTTTVGDLERRLATLERRFLLLARTTLALHRLKAPEAGPESQAEGDASDPRDLGVSASDGVSAEDVFGRE